MQRDATRALISILCQQQPALRRGIISRKPSELFVEALKAETKAERLSILEEELTCLGNLGRRISLQDERSQIPIPSYPINMPPFTFSTCPVM